VISTSVTSSGGIPASFKLAGNAYFGSFARSGMPAARGQPAWPRYESKARAVMLLTGRCRIPMDPGGQERKLWRSLGWT
jgi:para-nitrobenzyl esterase